MPAFAWSGQFIKDVHDFEAYLRTMNAPVWAKTAVVHHTYIPTLAQWRSQATVDGMKRYYQYDVKNKDGSRGWDSGPHVFNAPNGIWIGTPPNQIGTHAGIYNSTSWGIETVGNYDPVPFSPAIKAQLFGIIIALFKWRGITHVSLDTVRGHRECGSPKSCPGAANNMNTLRGELALALHKALEPNPGVTRWQIVRDPCPVRIARDIKASKALNNTAALPIGQIVDVDDITNGCLHLANSNPFRDL